MGKNPIASAVKCSRRGCLRKTTDPTRYCHDHRGLASSADKPMFAPPPAPVRTAVPGGVHPTGGYDEIEVVEEKTSTKRRYLRDGYLHRLDGPAEIESTGDVVLAEHYYRGGEFHREDGPAITVYAAARSLGFTGKLADYYYVDGSENRDDGPSKVSYDLDGVTVREEVYRTVGERTRIEGPTRVEYDESGALRQEYFRWKSRDLEREAFYTELAATNDDYLSSLIARSPLAAVVPPGTDPKLVLSALAAGVSSHEGIAEVVAGAPVEWVRAYEESKS